MKYDYLIVGSGLFGSIFACEANKKGKTCLVIDKRSHVGGNVYTQEVEGIHVLILKKLKVFMYINMVLIFSILQIKKFGIIFSSLHSLIDTQIHLLPIIKVKSTTCLLI